jgi:beta-glucanase (GH16 family)
MFSWFPRLDHESGNITGLSDTFENFHTYEIDWTPETITWLVDGKVGRTKKRADTWDAKNNQWAFPQTPSRVQLSIWPGGASSNGQGTIDWAGGPIDWSTNAPDIKSPGYYFATFGQIEVKCFNAPSGAGTNKKTSYYYTDIKATNDTVVDSDKPTIIGDFSATGTNMKGNGNGTNPGSTASAAAPVQSIPGGSSSGPGSNPGQAGSGTSSSDNCQTTGFSQSCSGSSSNNGKSAAPKSLERTTIGSLFALAVMLSAGLFL